MIVRYANIGASISRSTLASFAYLLRTRQNAVLSCARRRRNEILAASMLIAWCHSAITPGCPMGALTWPSADLHLVPNCYSSRREETMKISELIKELQAGLASHGDIEMVYTHHGDYVDVKFLEYSADKSWWDGRVWHSNLPAITIY
jgi:hypothetical protein